MTDCDSPECIQAHTRLQEARNNILSICNLLTQLRATAASVETQRNAMLLVAVAMLALVVAVGFAIPGLGPVAAIVAAILAGFLFLAAIGFLVAALNLTTRLGIINGQIDDLVKELTVARDAFDKAVAEVMANCPGPPSECWGELDQPTCP